MTSLNNLHALWEPALTALLTGFAASFVFGFCQYFNERRRRRDFRNVWVNASSIDPKNHAPPNEASSLWRRLRSFFPAKFIRAETEFFPSFPRYFLHRIRRYSFAIVSVTVVLLVRWQLESALQGSMPFSFFLAAVLFTARTQGVWETLLALALGFLMGTWFFVEPKSSSFFDHHDWWAAAIYLVIGSGIIWLLKSEQTAWLRTLSADISALKQTQQTRPVVSNEENKRHELLAQLVENARDAIVSITPEGNIMTWNSAAEELFGWSSKEAVGKSLTTLLPAVGQEESLQLEQHLGAEMSRKTLQTTFGDRNGTPVDATTTISPIKDEHSRMVGVSLIIRDQTDRQDQAISA